MSLSCSKNLVDSLRSEVGWDSLDFEILEAHCLGLIYNIQRYVLMDSSWSSEQDYQDVLRFFTN